MSSKKQKERKKKNREKIARYRVVKRREALRKEKKEAFEEQMKQKIAEDEVYGKSKPFVKKNSLVVELTEEEKKQKINEAQSKIDHNLKILEALEEEYDREQAQKKKINEDLEKEGYKTIKEKMDALHEKALVLEGKKEEYDNAQKEYAEKEEK
jgi:hypothetical protein